VQVKDFADLTAEVLRGIRFLKDGQALLNRTEQGNIGTEAGSENHGHFRLPGSDLRENLEAA